jgi:hypothetical protein
MNPETAETNATVTVLVRLRRAAFRPFFHLQIVGGAFDGASATILAPADQYKRWLSVARLDALIEVAVPVDRIRTEDAQ